MNQLLLLALQAVKRYEKLILEILYVVYGKNTKASF